MATGASKGLELALVKNLIEEGYTVDATSKSASSLEAAVEPKGDRHLPLEVNLSDESSVAAGVEKAISLCSLPIDTMRQWSRQASLQISLTLAALNYKYFLEADFLSELISVYRRLVIYSAPIYRVPCTSLRNFQ